MKANLNEVHEYWSSPDASNDPLKYLGNSDNLKRTDYLVRKFKRFARKKTVSIMELGCNVGRNLNGLYESGYHNLFGIEINRQSIELMQNHYPDLFHNIGIENDKLENILPKYEDNSIDYVFSMACLEHIHPDSDFIFDHIRRIARKGIVVIELEILCKNPRLFYRDYQKILEQDGCIQVEAEEVGERADYALSKHVYRRFKKS